MSRVVQIPTINDESYDFDTLFTLCQQLNGDNLDVTFEFSSCGFLKQNAVAFLGGLARLIEYRGGSVEWDWKTLQTPVSKNLAKQGFHLAFCNFEFEREANSIPYREDKNLDADNVIEYLKRKWIGRGWMNVSGPLCDAIAGRVWEIYANAFEHADSTIGVVSCGQYYPNLNVLKLTLVDFGVGIPANVRWFFKNDERAALLSSEKCIKWAFLPGKSTKEGGRGMGLDLLKEFVQVNHGKLEVFSHDGYALIANGQEHYTKRRTFFEGTVVNITLTCDATRYSLASEVRHEPLF